MATTHPPSARAVEASGWEVIASFDDYEQAQAAVDSLSDREFPVEHVQIVGHDLRLVESVTGRLTRTRAALAGAASGAWFGALFGLLVGLFADGPVWLGLILGGILIGAAWGAVIGLIAYAATGGRRDFTSLTAIVADRYDVVADAEHAQRARELLGTAR
jgi:hypothetical protein